MYLSSAWQKLRRGGLQWCNGSTLQAYLVEHYLWGDMLGALRLAQKPLLCRLLSMLVCTFELTFWLILVCPHLTYGYALSGIAFHVGTAQIMRIQYGTYLSPVYTVFTTEIALPILAQYTRSLAQ